jgi:hypothetical protein
MVVLRVFFAGKNDRKFSYFGVLAWSDPNGVEGKISEKCFEIGWLAWSDPNGYRTSSDSTVQQFNDSTVFSLKRFNDSTIQQLFKQLCPLGRTMFLK